MPFAAIQGQASAITTLQNALTHDRLGHAYLFVGPTGVGKKKTALALVQAVLCLDVPRAGCGICAACVAITAGTHPDVSVVGAEAGKQTIGIDQIRNLQRLLGLQPVRGGKKVALIEEAQFLTPQAQSALLKVVEEPPGDALLILLTVNAATLSRPLLSRCQQVRFSTLPVSVIEELLVREHAREPVIAKILARYSQGSIGRAVTLDPQVFSEERRYVMEELRQLSSASFITLSRLAEWLVAHRGKKPPKSTETGEMHMAGDRLELVLSWYEDALRYVLLGPEGVVCYHDCLPLLAQTAAGLGIAGALRQLTIVYDTLQALGRNANRQLAAEDMLLQLAAQGK